MEINWAVLRLNRNKLVAWQLERRRRPLADGEVRVNVGCGDTKWPGYIGVDIHPPADFIADVCNLDELFGENSVDEFVCQHVLEHIPFAKVPQVLKSFNKLLKPGGVLELGMPDAELCCIDFLTAEEERRWTTCENEIWGLPAQPGMAHHCGITLAKMKRLLQEAGFEILESYHYDANTVAPSLFIFAQKPLVEAIVAGACANRMEFIGELAVSIGKCYPQLPFLVHAQSGSMGANLEGLRQKFRSSGIRYWLFLDDTTRFSDKTTLSQALELIRRPEIAAVSTWIENSSCFQEKPVYSNFIHSYFMLVDSYKVGDLAFDLDIPGESDDLALDYSLSILAKGFRLAVAPTCIQHPEISKVNQSNEEANQYLQEKWSEIQFWKPSYEAI